MIGGEAADVERARPVLEAIGKNIVRAGASGAGQTARICYHMLSGIRMVGTTVALALGIANGLDPKVLSDIMQTSSGTNFALQRLNPQRGVMPEVPSSHGYAGGFRTDFQLKDMLLAVQRANESKKLATLGAVACNLFAMHGNNGLMMMRKGWRRGSPTRAERSVRRATAQNPRHKSKCRANACPRPTTLC